jgi:hypothetical protein
VYNQSTSILFLWQNFPIWQKGKKKRKKRVTTKPPNEFFPMRITHQRLFIFVAKFPHLAKGKKEKKRKRALQKPQFNFLGKNPPNSSGFKEFCFLNLSDLDNRS